MLDGRRGPVTPRSSAQSVKGRQLGFLPDSCQDGSPLAARTEPTSGGAPAHSHGHQLRREAGVKQVPTGLLPACLALSSPVSLTGVWRSLVGVFDPYPRTIPFTHRGGRAM